MGAPTATVPDMDEAEDDAPVVPLEPPPQATNVAHDRNDKGNLQSEKRMNI